MANAASANTIKVVARFRPENKAELEKGGRSIVRFDSEETCSLNSSEASGSFTFDRVFDGGSRQSDVFDFSIRSTVDDILNGYNGTVFAYGQTGAGKSYTMMGADIDDDRSKGIIPRIVEQIFASIMAGAGNIEYTVRVSYMEIYMERIRDLLAPQNDNLPVHEERNRGVYVKGLLEIYVASVQEVYEVMRRGGTARAVAATDMNQESSRSHSIFVVTVTQKNVETGSAKSGRLFLVDLAGSEKVGKTGASGQTLEEAKKINKSLSALGMVINALTDGRSTHVPYRDSKLTRILQESLGGNSRTTLIINCSPSSYNDVETLSTLRFGVRAKAIKNKPKINAELSPAELKSLLRRAQTQVTTYESYMAGLEDEVRRWRAGERVPEDRWTPAMGGVGAQVKSDIKLPRPATPSRTQSPTRSEGRVSTPTVGLEKDEREEFLRRENEFQDQLSERETQLVKTEAALEETRAELTRVKEQDKRYGRDNERLTSEVNEMRMQLEKVAYEGKEAQITMDALKEMNGELTSELDEVKQQLLDAKVAARGTDAAVDEKEKKKAGRMAEMLADFDLGQDVLGMHEERIRDAIQLVQALHDASRVGGHVSPEDLAQLRTRLMETQAVVRRAESFLDARSGAGETSLSSLRELEERLESLQRDHEEILERPLDEMDIDEVKMRLEKAYGNKRETDAATLQMLKQDLTKMVEENQRLRVTAEDLQRKTKTNGTASPVPNGKTAQQQIAEFDVMKKSLMRDLQNRCERVVELEISLDETRERYNNVLRSSNNRAQQKKMAFLERNLEQLTHVQRQLVEQNSSLKKEVAIAERKLIARNERIQSLEGLLHDSQEKLTGANHRFEAQLAAVKERLEAAKIGAGRGLPAGGQNGGFGGLTGSRIAKPLRGGGGSISGGTGMGAGTGAGSGGESNGPSSQGSIPAISALQSSSASPGKRSSWFFRE
ncbi:MAG: Kinesin heavy chain [Watsoniomyces obsoletus]|nr:MAG: Kinesin heavy chain [Watsoniomyces obsoletus]